jgi:hypothetical protein
MNQLVTKLAPPIVEHIEVPHGSSLSSVSNETAWLDPDAWQLVLSEAGLQPDALREMAKLLEEREAEEDMVSAWPKNTGLPNTIGIIPGHHGHAPRIKVALNPTSRLTGDYAYIPFGEASGSFEEPRPSRPGGLLPSPALLKQLHEFIERNRALLYRLDRAPEEGGISGVDLGTVLQKIGGNR